MQIISLLSVYLFIWEQKKKKVDLILKATYSFSLFFNAFFYYGELFFFIFSFYFFLELRFTICK